MRNQKGECKKGLFSISFFFPRKKSIFYCYYKTMDYFLLSFFTKRPLCFYETLKTPLYFWDVCGALNQVAQWESIIMWVHMEVVLIMACVDRASQKFGPPLAQVLVLFIYYFLLMG